MSLSRRNPRRDDTEKAIVDALQAIGCTVRRLSGRGVPDLAVYHWREGWRLLEVKSATGELTLAQLETYRVAPFLIVSNVSEALAIFGVKC